MLVPACGALNLVDHFKALLSTQTSIIRRVMLTAGLLSCKYMELPLVPCPLKRDHGDLSAHAGAKEDAGQPSAGAWGAAMVADALHTINTDVGRVQSILPELSPRDRCVAWPDAWQTLQTCSEAPGACLHASHTMQPDQMRRTLC